MPALEVQMRTGHRDSLGTATSSFVRPRGRTTNSPPRIRLVLRVKTIKGARVNAEGPAVCRAHSPRGLLRCAGLARPAHTLRADATACGWSKRRKKCSLKGRGRRHLSCPRVDLPRRARGNGMCGPALLGCPVRGPFPRMSGAKRDRGAELSASARLTFCAGE